MLYTITRLLFTLVPIFLSSCMSSQRNLRVAVAPDYPSIIQKSNGQIIGMEADFAKELAKELGYKLQFVETDWSQIIDALKQNKADIIMSGMSITPSCAHHVTFSNPLMNINQMLLIRKSEITKFRKPGNNYYINSNMRVGVIKATSGEELARKHIAGNRISHFKSLASGTVALRKKLIDCLVCDSPSVFPYAMNKDPELIGVYWKFSDEKIAWQYEKGTLLF